MSESKHTPAAMLAAAEEVMEFPHPSHCDHLHDAAALLRWGAAEVERLREALGEMRDRIQEHPAYADLTEAEEIETGGWTAELAYLARVANAALAASQKGGE